MQTVPELIKLIAPLIGQDKANQLLYRYSSLPDIRRKRIFENNIQLLAYKYLGPDYEEKILLPPPGPESVSSENPLGTVLYHATPFYPFGISNKELLMHTAILGRTGSGKTNVAYALLFQLLRQKVPFLIFDWKKNYRQLLLKDKNLLLFTPGNPLSPLSFNPLIPPRDVNPKMWKEFLVSIIGYSYFIGEGALTLIEQAIEQAYQDFGVYNGTMQNAPTFKDVAKYIWSKGQRRGREMLWQQSGMRTLHALTSSTLADCINVSKPISLEALLKNNVVIELDALAPPNKIFLTQALLLWIYFQRLSQQKTENLQQLILIEEAQNLLLKDREEINSGNIMPKIIREFRELGIGLCFIAQEPSKMNTTALQNTYTLIALNQRYRKDIEILGSSMSLKFQEWDYLGKLPLGHALVNTKGNFPGSFLVRFPLVKPLEDVSDEIIRKRIIPPLSTWKHPEYPRKEERKNFQVITGNAYPSPLAENHHDMKGPETPLSPEKEARKTMGIPGTTQEEVLFLLEVHTHPNTPVTHYYGKLKLTPRNGLKIKGSLIRKGLLVEEILTNGYGRKKLLRLTSKGEELLKDRGHIEGTTGRKNGIQHRYWRSKIRERFEKDGYTVKEEVSISQNGFSESIDLVAEKNNKKYAIEIETGKNTYDQITNNIKKCLKAEYDKVYAIGTCKKACQKIKEAVVKNFLSKDPRVIVLSHGF